MKTKPLKMMLDIEASGWVQDGAGAIELAYSSDKTGEIFSFLINPEPLYAIDNRFRYWSHDAQRVHNISLEMLRKDGVNPFWLVDHLNEQLKDKILYSDAPIYDMEWIDVIYNACDVKRTWKIKSVSGVWLKVFGSHYRKYVLHYKRKLEDEGIIHTHRAADDVRVMLEIYKRGLKKE